MATLSANMYPDIKEEDLVTEVHEIVVQRVGHVPVAKGDFSKLPKAVKIFVSHCVSVLDAVFTWCVSAMSNTLCPVRLCLYSCVDLGYTVVCFLHQM